MVKIFMDNCLVGGIGECHLSLPFVLVEGSYAAYLAANALKIRVNRTLISSLGETITDPELLASIFVFSESEVEILKEQVIELQSLVVDVTYNNLIGGM